MNDIWALPSGEWVVYSDEKDIIRDFLSLADMEVVTSYHGIIKKHSAMQFKFQNQKELLRYVCFMTGFSYGLTVRLLKTPGTSYKHAYAGIVYQPSLLVEVEPRRKKKRQ